MPYRLTHSPDHHTLAIGDRDAVRGDLVWAVRRFRPDVIVTRFPTTGAGGHGDPAAPAILAAGAAE